MLYQEHLRSEAYYIIKKVYQFSMFMSCKKIMFERIIVFSKFCLYGYKYIIIDLHKKVCSGIHTELQLN